VTCAVLARQRLAADEIAAIERLVAAAGKADGVTPVSEHAVLHVRHDGGGATNLLARDNGLVGFAHLDSRGDVAELVVDPGHRRVGVGSALLDAVERASTDGPVVWAHGRLDAATAMAKSRGYVEQRVLWQLRTTDLTRLPQTPLPAGVVLRPFIPGTDEQAWLDVNNRAFASHPEQSGQTLDDITAREAEPWFDPYGFLLAVRESDGAIVGFHWTKVHGPAVGEVYVLGVDPAAQRGGLGAALTIAGLAYLRDVRGVSEVVLYVDESNPAAMRMYEKLGFERLRADVQFGRPNRSAH